MRRIFLLIILIIFLFYGTNAFSETAKEKTIPWVVSGDVISTDLPEDYYTTILSKPVVQEKKVENISPNKIKTELNSILEGFVGAMDSFDSPEGAWEVSQIDIKVGIIAGANLAIVSGETETAVTLTLRRKENKKEIEKE